MRQLILILFALLFFACNDLPADQLTKAASVTKQAPPAGGITDVNPLNDPTPLDQMITYEGISAGAVLPNPYILRGKAVGGWFFEGSFPVRIIGEDGNLIASSPGKAMGEWMTEGWVPYQSKLTWITGPNTKAILVLELSNPAEEGEGKRRAVEIPVVLQ